MEADGEAAGGWKSGSREQQQGVRAGLTREVRHREFALARAEA